MRLQIYKAKEILKDYFCNRFFWRRRTMDSIRVSEAPDTGSIPVETTKKTFNPFTATFSYTTLNQILFLVALFPVNQLLYQYKYP